MSRQSKTDLARECGDVVHGIQTELAGMPALDFAGVSYTRAQLIAVFQGMLDAIAKTRSAELAYLQTLAGERKLRPRVRAVRNAFKTFLEGRYGKGSTKLALFGFDGGQPAKPTVVVKAAAAQKRKATREARRTMGPRQKAKIEGVAPVDPKKARTG